MLGPLADFWIAARPGHSSYSWRTQRLVPIASPGWSRYPRQTGALYRSAFALHCERHRVCRYECETYAARVVSVVVISPRIFVRARLGRRVFFEVSDGALQIVEQQPSEIAAETESSQHPLDD